MLTTALFVLAGTMFLAYANGANDNFKGVATLAGSGTTDDRRALYWATITTFAGSTLAILWADRLIQAFSGKGLVPDAVAAEPVFLAAVALGAAATVIIATFAGLPVSTTHALVGALAGSGLVAAGSEVGSTKLGAVFVLPLLLGPVAALVLALLAYPPLRWLRQRLKITSETCVCIGTGKFVPVGAAADGCGQLSRTDTPTIVVDDTSRCVQRYAGDLMGVSAASATDLVHYLSAGAVSFARGLNDTPKIVALLISAQALAALTGGTDSRYGFALVAVCMAVGGLLSARKVAGTMSRDITAMNVGQGLTANLVTAFLVLVASRFGLPVSTTHVSCGALFGIGTVTRQARWKTIRTIIAAWVTTLPIVALLSGLSYFAIRAMIGS